MDKEVTPLKAGFKWSLYSSTILLAFFGVCILTGWFDFINADDTKYYIVLGVGFITTLATISGALLYFRKHNEHLLTFGEGLSIGIFMGIFTAVLLALGVFVFLSINTPDITSITDDPSLDEDPVRLPVALAFSTSIFTFLGFVGLSLISCLIFKKD